MGLVIFNLGCASTYDMRAIEPRATYRANNDVLGYRDCLFRWTSGYSKYVTREYTDDGLFLNAGESSPMWMIAQADGEINVHVHWNSLNGRDVPVYIAGRCNDDVSSEPPNGSWRNIRRESDWGQYVP